MARGTTVRDRVTFRRLDDPGVVRAWDELATATQAGPFSRPGWFQAWSRAFGPSVTVAIVQDGSALVPVLRTSHAMTSPTNEHSPEFASVAGSLDARTRLYRDLIAEEASTFHFMKIGAGELEALLAAAKRVRVSQETFQRSPYLDVDRDWSSYEASLNAAFRQGLRRKQRRLGDLGDVSVRKTTGENLDAALREGFAIEGSRWKTTARTAIASQAETLAFYTAIARWAAENGWLRLWFLRTAGVPIAFRFDLEIEGVYYHLKGGYDPQYARFSPGLLLQHATVKEAFGNGIRRYEFLGADEDYKMKWTKTTRDRLSLRVFKRGPRGTAVWLDRAVARPAGKRLLHRA